MNKKYTYKDFRKEHEKEMREINRDVDEILDCDIRAIRGMFQQMLNLKDRELFKLLYSRKPVEEDRKKLEELLLYLQFFLKGIIKIANNWLDERKMFLKSEGWLLRAIISDESFKDSHTQSQAKKILEWLESKVELSMENKNED